MQLNMETDYAIRCLMYLARCEAPTSSLAIGKALMLNRNYAQKILKKLRNSGFLTVTRGSMGGYMLARPASTINMKEVLDILEDTMMISRCLEPDTYCSIRWAGHCGARSFFRKLQNAIDECSESISVEDLVRADDSGQMRFPGDIFSFIRSRSNKEYIDIIEDNYCLEEALLCKSVAEEMSSYDTGDGHGEPPFKGIDVEDDDSEDERSDDTEETIGEEMEEVGDSPGEKLGETWDTPDEEIDEVGYSPGDRSTEAEDMIED